MLSIKEVTTIKELKDFIEFPYRMYAGNPYFVPPLRFDEMNTLRKDKNPAFEYCQARYWLAYHDNCVVGRIAGIINESYIAKWGKKSARFGWVDFIDDVNVSRALFETVETWAKDKGMEYINGPQGFCDMDKEGLLVEGFEELGTMITIYNHPYYPAYIEGLGYCKDVDWLEYQVGIPAEVPEKIARISEKVKEKYNLRVVKAKKSKELIPYVKGIFNLLNVAYKDLYGVVELTDAQIAAYTKQYFGFIDPDYVSVVIDENNDLVAFAIAMPSLSRALQKAGGSLFPFGFAHLLKAMRINSSIDLYLVAVRPDFQGKGVNSILMDEITSSCIENGITKAEAAPQLEDNSKVLSLWRHYEVRQHKRRRCYSKKL